MIIYKVATLARASTTSSLSVSGFGSTPNLETGTKYFLRKNEAENHKSRLEQSIELLNVLHIYSVTIIEVKVNE